MGMHCFMMRGVSVKNIIIMGVGRAGKSTLSKMIKDLYPQYDVVHADAIKWGIISAQGKEPEFRKDIRKQMEWEKSMFFQNVLIEVFAHNVIHKHTPLILDTGQLYLENKTKNEPVVDYIRLQESGFTVSEEDRQIQRTLLTAYDLTQYKNEYHSLELATGVRVGEVGGLLWSDIDFEKRLVHIRHNLECTYVEGRKIQQIYTPKTGYSIRDLPFDMGAWDLGEILERQKYKTDTLRKTLGTRWRDSEDVVFVTTMGSKCSRYIVASEIKRVLRRFKNGEYNVSGTLPDFHPHSIRHSFATRCAEKGVDVKVAYKLLGHSSITITMEIYQHVTDRLKSDEIKKLGKSDDTQTKV